MAVPNIKNDKSFKGAPVPSRSLVDYRPPQKKVALKRGGRPESLPNYMSRQR
jgi:hypothetical protein